MAQTPNDKIIELEHQIYKHILDINNIKKLQTKFKDLKFYSGRRFNKGAYYTSEVNSLVDNIDIYDSCSCCNDAALYCSSYLIVDGIRVYSNPIEFYIAESAGNGTYYFKEDYICELINENINRQVIDKIEDYKNEYSYESVCADENDI